MWHELGIPQLLIIKKSNQSWTNVILSCKPGDFKLLMVGSQSKMGFWEPMMQNIEGNSVWISWYHEPNFLGLALALGFDG